MLRSIKLVAVSILALLSVNAPVLVSAPAAAQSNLKDSLACGADLNVTGANCTSTTASSGTTINNLITRIINIFSVVVGVIAVIMIIIGGLKYIMSGGDAKNVTGAKNTILYAIIGLVVVALAQAIVKFVLSNTPTA